MNTTTIQPNEKLAQLTWTAIILMFFMIQAVIWTVAFSITSRDTSHSVVAGYDEQALNWDKTQAVKRASEKLGWTSALDVESEADVMGNRTIRLNLTDANDQPIENAAIAIQAFHRGRSADVQPLEMTESEPGIYTGIVRVRHVGNWQFTGTAIHEDKSFLIDVRPYLGKASH